jgi:outer membrane lipoprotein-sorting protein
LELVCFALNGRAAEDLDRWLSQQANVTTWSAEVTQTRRLKSLAEPLVTPGRVWFQAPNLFRWELGAPAQTVAVRERERLVLLYPRLRRAEVYPLDGESEGPWRSSLTLLEAGFPQRRGQLEEQFDILGIESEGTTTVVRLRPKSAKARRWVAGLRVTLRSDDLSLRATELEFADGSQLRNEFHGVAINPSVPVDLLEARIPDDYTVTHP